MRISGTLKFARCPDLRRFYCNTSPYYSRVTCTIPFSCTRLGFHSFKGGSAGDFRVQELPEVGVFGNADTTGAAYDQGKLASMSLSFDSHFFCFGFLFCGVSLKVKPGKCLGLVKKETTLLLLKHWCVVFIHEIDLNRKEPILAQRVSKVLEKPFLCHSDPDFH